MKFLGNPGNPDHFWGLVGTSWINTTARDGLDKNFRKLETGIEIFFVYAWVKKKYVGPYEKISAIVFTNQLLLFIANVQYMGKFGFGPTANRV